MIQVIYDGFDIQVLIDFVSRQKVIYSFSSFTANNSSAPAYGNGFVQKLGYTGVFFISKNNHWWQTIEFDEAIECALSYTKDIETRIAYGQSMGAYGALLASGKLNCMSIVSAPQTSISHPDIELNPIWKSFIIKYKLIRDNVCESIEASLGAIVLYDPLEEIDIVHYKYISSISGVLGLAIPFGTHQITTCLREMGIISQVFEGLFKFGKCYIQEARVKIRERRFISKTYISNITHRVIKRKNSYLFKDILRSAMLDVFNTDSYPGYNLPHLFHIITSCVLDRKPLLKFDFPNVKLYSLSKDIEIFNEKSSILRSTGTDPRIIFDLVVDGHVEKISISMYSSVDGEAIMYYTTSSLPNEFNRDQVLSFQVNAGFNNLLFITSGIDLNKRIRFDPLRGPGLFKIKNILINSLD